MRIKKEGTTGPVFAAQSGCMAGRTPDIVGRGASAEQTGRAKLCPDGEDAMRKDGSGFELKDRS